MEIRTHIDKRLSRCSEDCVTVRGVLCTTARSSRGPRKVEPPDTGQQRYDCGRVRGP